MGLSGTVGCEPGTLMPPDAPDAHPPEPPAAEVTLHALHARRQRNGQKLAGPMLEAEISFTLPRDNASVSILTRCESGSGLMGSADLLAARGLVRGQHARLFVPLFAALPLLAMPQRCELRFFVAPRPGSGEAPGAAGVYCAQKGVTPGRCSAFSAADNGKAVREVVVDGGSVVLTFKTNGGPAKRTRITADRWPTTVTQGRAKWCVALSGTVVPGGCP